jgi:integrative and conjugative element protein (TIGR02256 family)
MSALQFNERQRVSPMEYVLPTSNQKLILTEPVLQVFRKFRQKPHKAEAGGLLFAEFHLPEIKVVFASTPSRWDNRSRFLFIPHRASQRQIIPERFDNNQHLIGEWHTHPEPRPTPSLLDLQSMKESFVKSRHELNYFLMIIVGNMASRLELWVSIHNGRKVEVLERAK